MSDGSNRALAIRRATAADADGIAHVQVETWRSSYRGIVPQSYLDALDVREKAASWKRWVSDSDAHTFVADDAGEICGYVHGGVLRDGVHVAAQGYDAEIHKVYVLSDAQGKGIGRKLMSVLAESLVRDGLMRPVVWALAENPWCRFYERLGGKKVAEKMIEIGGAPLLDHAFGWETMSPLLASPGIVTTTASSCQ
jgi:ribosomal protein S18 acetylase RimI-like enzyme